MFLEKIQELTEVINKAGEKLDLDAVDTLIRSCQSYVESVVSMERTLSILRYRLEAEEFQMKVMDCDKRRHAYHEGLMAQINMVNRICTMIYNLPPIFEFTDRYEAADFAGKLNDELFQKGKERSNR